MVAYLQNPQPYAGRGMVEGDSVKNLNHFNDVAMSVEQHRQNYHRNLDLNRPAFNPVLDEIGRGCRVNQRKKRRLGNIKNTSKEAFLNLDLTLSLSLPGMTDKGEAPGQSECSPFLSRQVSILGNGNPNGNLPRNGAAASSLLTLRGCLRCLLYILVCETDPKCPRCQTTDLIDPLCESAAKKARRT